VKKILVLLLVYFSFIAGFLLRGHITSDKSINSSNPSPSTTIISTQDKFKVVKVLDGDTIVIDTGEKVRYLGIDAPEPNDAYGTSSTKYNDGLVSDKEVKLEYDYEKIDKYGRTLAYVWVDEVLVNEKMVEEGFANVYTIPRTRKLKYIDRLNQAQQWAKDHHNGMWIEKWRN